MSDYGELKKLAEAAVRNWPDSKLFDRPECDRFIDAAHPDVVLALIADYDRLEQECERLRGECEGCPMSIAEDMRMQRDAAIKQVEGLRRDAARYRLYREGFEDPDVFDANVDAALLQTEGGS